MRGVFKLNRREITFYRSRAANAFCQGPVAGKYNLRDKLQGRRTLWNRGNGWWWLTAIPSRLKGGPRQPAELHVPCLVVNGHPVCDIHDMRFRIELTGCGSPSATSPAAVTMGCCPAEPAARELLPVCSGRRSAGSRQPCPRKSAVRFAWEPNPGQRPRTQRLNPSGGRGRGRERRLGFSEHLQPGAAKPLASVPPAPDTGVRIQAFASASCRENWRVPSLDPGPAA